MAGSRSILSCLIAMLPSIVPAANVAQAAVEISSKATKNMVCSQGVCTPTARNAILNVTDLATMLASGDVTVKSDSQSLDIDMHAALSWTSTHALTLDSYHSIAFDRSVTVAGTGALTITTNDGGTGGDYRFFGKGHVEFWDTQSVLTINGKWYELADGIRQLRRLIRQNGTGRYALARNVNAHEKAFIESPLGTFGGSFEGLGNTVTNLTINSTLNGGFVALFESLYTGVIRDLHLKNANITLNGLAYAATLVGGNGGIVANCDASGQITLGVPGSYAGGLVAIGASVVNSSAAVSISGPGAAGIGGLIGQKNTVEHDNSILDQNFATGTLVGGDSTSVGGLIGRNYGAKITNSYSTSSVSGGSTASAGGLAGLSADDPDSGIAPQISTSYSTGAVSAGAGSSVGGLLGTDAADSTNTNAYWDLDTSNIDDPSRGAGNIANDPGITGLTDAQLKSALPAGFDPKIWGIDPKINNGYPYLLNNPPR